MPITLVKKIKADGAPCRKCAEVESRLEAEGLMPRIDRVVVADERDAGSEGMQLAATYGVDQAPFFMVERDGSVQIYTVFYRFLKEVLNNQASEQEEIAELMQQNPDLDHL